MFSPHLLIVDPRTYRMLQLVEQGKSVYIASKRWQLEEDRRRAAMPIVDNSAFWLINRADYTTDPVSLIEQRANE